MIFRPALWMTLLMLPSLGLLLLLGTWQLARLEWKQGLIADFEARTRAEAIIPPLLAEGIDAPRFQRILVKGIWLHEAETHLIGRTFEGTAGYHVVTPMRLEDGRILLLNRGWVAEDYRRRETRPSSLEEGEVELEAIIRLPAKKGYFVPENDPQGDDWFTLEISDIVSWHGLGSRGEVITAYTADVVRASEGSYTMPIGAKIEVDIPNDHLGYALTWYGLAVALIGVYGVWHHQAGRLSFKR